MAKPVIRTVFGVDFSGAATAGENMYLARVEGAIGGRGRVAELSNVGELAGTTERAAVMRTLVELIADSQEALWGMDFPFALPVELFDAGVGFDEQLEFVRGLGGTAKDFGRGCVERCRERLGQMHVRRATDVEARTPFDCYHYRIVYQTFHGMRDVLLPLRSVVGTAIAPFDGLVGASRVVVEACPSSTLKRLRWPHQRYKQTTPGPMTPARLKVRKEMYEGLRGVVDVPAGVQRVISRNAGGDALDAVLAAVGTAAGWKRFNPTETSAHPRYSREGFIFF